MFVHNEIVINKRTSQIYFYDESDINHRRALFSCRATTLQEQKRFLKLGVRKAPVRDIGLKRQDILKKEYEITFVVHEINIKRLNDYLRLNKFDNYNDVLNFILNNVRVGKVKEQKKYENEKKIIKSLQSLINDIKKSIEE